MKISYHWLKEYIEPELAVSPEETARLLTGAGLEVESTTTFSAVTGGLEGLVIGEVMETRAHPGADRLTITRVRTGADDHRQIVCGAPNVAAGQKVVVALPGATLYPAEGEPFRIKKSKIRGEESDGMICAEGEIGLGKDHSGIIILPAHAIPGEPVAAWYGINNDTIFEIGLTPNRKDAVSHQGVARDLVAVLNAYSPGMYRLRLPEVQPAKQERPCPVRVIVEDGVSCPRYSGLVVRNLRTGPSPAWLANRLRSIGLQPVNNVVDITNFVLHEMGQPLHAFDLEKVGAEIRVKKPANNAPFTTLDGATRTLSADDLMICNAAGGMCITGVYGGAASGVTDSTTAIFLESACFHPDTIRITSQRHGLKTDASSRFEKGMDPGITLAALERAAALMAEIAGGEVDGAVADIYPVPVPLKEVYLALEKVRRVSGMEIATGVIQSILGDLGILITEQTSTGMYLRIPHWKPDVSRGEDVIEEVLRIYGYNHIPVPEKMRSASVAEDNRSWNARESVSALLASLGFFETMNLSISRSRYHADAGGNLVPLLNTSNAELDVMRPSLLEGMLESLVWNQNRQQKDVRFFEFGNAFSQSAGELHESQYLAVLMAGSRFPESWDTSRESTGFFDLKGVVHALLDRLGIGDYSITGQQAAARDMVTYTTGSDVLVTFGRVQKSKAAVFDIRGEVWYAGFHWDNLLNHTGQQIRYKEIPRFPSVRRDLAVILDRGISYQATRDIMEETCGKLLRETILFDIFGNPEKIGEGKKQYAIGLTFMDEKKTLKDSEVDFMMENLVKILHTKLGAIRR